MTTNHAHQKELSFLVLFSGSKDDDCPEVHPIHQAASKFAEAVERRTDGEVTIKVHAVNTLYTQQETLEKVSRGIVDMCTATQGVLDKYVSAFALVMMPFIYDGYKHAYRVLDGPFSTGLTRNMTRSTKPKMGICQSLDSPSCSCRRSYP